MIYMLWSIEALNRYSLQCKLVVSSRVRAGMKGRGRSRPAKLKGKRRRACLLVLEDDAQSPSTNLYPSRVSLLATKDEANYTPREASYSRIVALAIDRLYKEVFPP